MIVDSANVDDVNGFLALAGGVEDWFGMKATDPEFETVVRKNIGRGSAWVVRAPGAELLGGIMMGGRAPVHRINWLVVSEKARGRGVGTALVRSAIDRFERPCRVDVLTFGADHPAALEGAARIFYERFGFAPGEDAATGPEGGSRQWYHLELYRQSHIS